ncbi:MAG TPA: phosphatidylglycerophosphatase A [Opitutaceae bacterium]|nr:phosphatidylglycerophosphatase A [Opitutaceae bacterium]
MSRGRSNRPWPRALPTGIVLACARLGPIGRKLPAPGTWGSVAGLCYFTALAFCFPGLRFGGLFLLHAAGIFLAVALCGEAEVRLGRKDPGEVILDEFVAMPLCYLGWSQLAQEWPRWVVLLAGLAFFRLFDILKPFGIRRLQDLPGGWGVVIDDVAAALAACVTMHVGQWVWRLV